MRSYLAAIGAFIVNALVASLFLYRVAIVLPKKAIHVRIFSCLNDLGNSLHLSPPSRGTSYRACGYRILFADRIVVEIVGL